MADGYVEAPHNLSEIMPYVIADRERITAEILWRRKCYFYDACSFRRHANLERGEADCLLKYIKIQNGAVAITGCVLMELASKSGRLHPCYVEYIRHMKESGVVVLFFYEEELFSVMGAAFATNAAVNAYLCWAVRMIKGPVSTITETLTRDERLCNEVIRGRNLDSQSIYRRFFAAARNGKEPGDNLGEELLAICLHILSHLPGEEDGKFCILTDDKGAAGKIDHLFQKTARQYRGKEVGIFSTPKLVQILYREGILKEKERIKAFLEAGAGENLVVLGMRAFDIRSREISIGTEELAELILQPNGIHLIF